jgi:ribosomal silencing factor RsfS
MATSNDKIYEILIDIQGRVCSIEALVSTIQSLERIVLKGNGTQPLTQRMDNAEKYIKDQKDAIREKKEGLSKFQWILITALTGNIIGTIVSYFR